MYSEIWLIYHIFAQNKVQIDYKLYCYISSSKVWIYTSQIQYSRVPKPLQFLEKKWASLQAQFKVIPPYDFHNVSISINNYLTSSKNLFFCYFKPHSVTFCIGIINITCVIIFWVIFHGKLKSFPICRSYYIYAYCYIGNIYLFLTVKKSNFNFIFIRHFVLNECIIRYNIYKYIYI